MPDVLAVPGPMTTSSSGPESSPRPGSGSPSEPSARRATVPLEVNAKTPSDADLVALARDAGADGGEAFRALFDRWRDETFGFLVGVLRDRALAEDVHQETFFRVFLNLDRYDPERAFRPWLLQIARNAALDALRLRRKGERLVEVKAREPAALSPDAAHAATVEDEAAKTERALASLAPEARALLIERHTLGLKLEDLARSWALDERTIRTRLRAAADSLARALSGKGPPP